MGQFPDWMKTKLVMPKINHLTQIQFHPQIPIFHTVSTMYRKLWILLTINVNFITATPQVLLMAPQGFNLILISVQISWYEANKKKSNWQNGFLWKYEVLVFPVSICSRFTLFVFDRFSCVSCLADNNYIPFKFGCYIKKLVKYLPQLFCWSNWWQK